MTNALKSWILLIILSIIWGSSFILMKKGMYGSNGLPIFSAPQVGSLRMLIASSVLLPWAIKGWQSLRSKKDILYFSIVGTCGSFLPAFLFTFAETGITSGLAGMLNSFTPIFTILLGLLIFQQRLNSYQYIGVSIGTVGIILLVLSGKQSSLSGDTTHILAVIAATLFYAISLSTIKYKLQHYSSMQVTSISLSLIWIPAFVIVLMMDTPTVILENDLASDGLYAIIVLALFGTAIATILFNATIRLSSALFASSVTYLMPIVSVLIGWRFGEVITAAQIGSMFIILLGILLANLPGLLRLKSSK
ncbi:MAG: DMT family transporter [Bacteroidetes bacterium]|nr:DMT family transporter [Bacteroidota bacterium]